MKRWRLLLSLLLILGILLIPVLAFATSPDQSGKTSVSARDESYATDRILVKFKPGISERVRQDIHRAHGASVVGELKGIGVQILKVPNSKVMEKVLAYRAHGSVEYAEPDYIATAYEVPNDPSFNQQWGMTQIDAPEAWSATTGSSSVKIAILDTGIDIHHPDLDGKITSSDMHNYTDSPTADDLYGHGTHVAGIAAAETNNDVGVADVGYNCSLASYKVLNDTGSGDYSWIAEGIMAAADDGVAVINMSLGSKFASSTLQSAVDYAWSKGVVIVASAGNAGNSRPSYPAYYTNCIAVAATDSLDAKASFSTYGSWVDVAAPGVNIYSTMPSEGSVIGLTNYGLLSGTSMSAPHVAGLAALVKANKGGTNTDIRGWIEDSAEPVGSIWTTYGIKRINALAAVDGTDVNQAPVVTIMSPAGGASFPLGTSVTFTGSAVDAEDGELSGSLTWTSSLDGIIGAGENFNTSALSNGTHTITASVTDSNNLQGVASITITITISASTVTVEEIELIQAYWVNPATWKVELKVFLDQPLEGAVVSGSWSNGAVSSGSTGIDGVCTITSGNLSKKLASVTYKVTSVSFPGYSFVDSSDSSTTVNKPQP